VRTDLRLGPGAVVLAAFAAGLASPASGPAMALPRQPVRESIDAAVERVLQAHLRPCELESRQQIPCFPTLVEAESDRLSVAASVRGYRPDGSTSPSRPPTTAEMAPYRSGGPQAATGAVSLGDLVCSAKALWKDLRGRGGPYYLYQIWDIRGEEPLLTDRELDPAVFSTRPDFRYVLVGKYDEDCAAIAAWRKALRETQAPPAP
jgi:hypothetical protein